MPDLHGYAALSLLSVCELLTVVASLVEHGLWGLWASVAAVRGHGSCVSRALEHRPKSCGTLA